MDNLLGSLNLKEVNWIKIDVEGAELDALKGTEKILANSKDLTLIIEIHGSEIFTQITGFLEAHSFRIILEEMNEKRDWGHVVAHK